MGGKLAVQAWGAGKEWSVGPARQTDGNAGFPLRTERWRAAESGVERRPPVLSRRSAQELGGR